jgi:hypothetical protein
MFLDVSSKLAQLFQVLVEHGVHPIHVNLKVAVNQGIAEAGERSEGSGEWQGQDPECG